MLNLCFSSSNLDLDFFGTSPVLIVCWIKLVTLLIITEAFPIGKCLNVKIFKHVTLQELAVWECGTS